MKALAGLGQAGKSRAKQRQILAGQVAEERGRVAHRFCGAPTSAARSLELLRPKDGTELGPTPGHWAFL